MPSDEHPDGNRRSTAKAGAAGLVAGLLAGTVGITALPGRPVVTAAVVVLTLFAVAALVSRRTW